MATDKEQNEYRFELRIGVSGTDRDTWGVIASYPNGREANAAKTAYGDAINDTTYPLSLLTTVDGERVEPAGKVLAIVRCLETGEPEGDANWRQREAERFISGRYRRVPWDGQNEEDYPDWGGHNWQEAYPDHFVHVAESDARKVSFTPDDVKGRKDKQTVLSVSDYLERFYSNPNGDCDCCDHDDYMQQRTRARFVAMLQGDATTVEFATTGEKMEAIYVECGRDKGGNEVSSCMAARADRYASVMHPVRVYAAGDLQLAYIRDERGNLWSRCLVWPERLCASRVYGAGGLALKNALRALGYTKFGSEFMDGARLLRVKNGERDEYVMPYIDGIYRFDDGPDDNTFVIASDGPYVGDRTDGVAAAVPPSTCDHCDEMIPHGHDRFEINEETWCYSCQGNYAFQCNECFNRFGNDERTITGEGHYICPSCLSEHYTEVSEGSGGDEYWRNRDVAECDTCETSYRRRDLTRGRCETCCTEHGEPEAPRPDANGWIAWDASEDFPPIGRHSQVDVIYRGREETHNRACDWGWRDHNITAYRPRVPEPVVTDGTWCRWDQTPVMPLGLSDDTLVDVNGQTSNDRPRNIRAGNVYWPAVTQWRHAVQPRNALGQYAPRVLAS